MRLITQLVDGIISKNAADWFVDCSCVCAYVRALCVQRPSAKDLLKHRFVQRAKKTSFLTELIDRYRHWRVSHPDSDDDDAEDSDQYVDTHTHTHTHTHARTHARTHTCGYTETWKALEEHDNRTCFQWRRTISTRSRSRRA